MIDRCQFLKTLAAVIVTMALSPVCSAGIGQTADRPNVVLIITDDQGYGDFGFIGNPVIKTPALDTMARNSARMNNYYVSPVCAPTRACLMTGRYNYRTRVVDTWIGRAMMEPEEVTLAEMLKAAGYATGLFGKWHLGDNYPMRPQDQGFDEVLMHRGGGIGQPADPPGGEGKYTDPILIHNGVETPQKGYCTDIYFDAALAWMERQVQRDKNFFAYVPTNAPHGPFHDVPQAWYEHYKGLNLGSDQFPQDSGHPLPEERDKDKLARIFAMISNIDDNVKKLFSRIEAMGQLDKTLVLFMVDNGPNTRRYVAGMLGKKSNVYEGGVRSPLYLHWPGRLAAGKTSDVVVAHFDILPTVLEACGVQAAAGVKLDGRSFWPLLTQENAAWPDRYITIQAHRGDAPLRYHNFMMRNQKWKLLHDSGFGRETFAGLPKFELYDMEKDPLEMQDLAATRPEQLARMKRAYDTWFDDVGSTRPNNYAPPRIHVGTPHENPVVLTRQDWRHFQGRPWADNSNGIWKLYVANGGDYTVRLRLRENKSGGRSVLKIGDQQWTASHSASDQDIVYEHLRLPKGKLDLLATLTSGDQESGPHQVDVLFNNQ
ncbi:MAG: arylsulfatase [Planctomycetes bacterium]|nr:arylsulfatase [Planctomycetota bacterium]